ncbi:MAG: hypothetical protein ACKPKO_57285 [Candidatus Fonsibacter sp.]
MDAHLWLKVAGFEVRKEHTCPVHVPAQVLLDLKATDMQVYAAETPPDPLAHTEGGTHEELWRR